MISGGIRFLQDLTPEALSPLPGYNRSVDFLRTYKMQSIARISLVMIGIYFLLKSVSLQWLLVGGAIWVLIEMAESR